MEKVILQLEGLTCPACMQKIEGAISKQTGVTKAKVLFNASKVKAEIDSNQTSAAALQAVVETLGYSVESVKVKELS